MMKRTKKAATFAAIALMPFFTLTACDSDAEDAVEDVGESIEDTAEEIGDGK